MGVGKKTRKFAQVKRMLGSRDNRIKKATDSQAKAAVANKNGTGANSKADAKKDAADVVRYVPQNPSGLFFQANESLGPPYHIILDTNFFSHSVRNKVDIQTGLMDLLLAKCIPVVTDCTIAELEKLGSKFAIPRRLAKDERWQRHSCSHTGTYADDCIFSLVETHRIYLVGTNDKGLRIRLRKLPGVPLIGVGKGKYTIERLPDVM